MPVGVPDYIAAAFARADRPQSVPSAGLAGRLPTWPDTSFSSRSPFAAPAQTASSGGTHASEQLSAAFQGSAAASWDAAAAAADADPIKQVQMRFRSRAAPPPPQQQQFASLSFPVHGIYPVPAPPWQQQQQQRQQHAASRFHSISQDSVVSQYRQQVRAPAGQNQFASRLAMPTTSSSYASATNQRCAPV